MTTTRFHRCEAGATKPITRSATSRRSVMLTALVHRQFTGEGQFIDVNMHAAQNVTTEGAVYHWLVAGDTVQRQTGRHSSPTPTANVQIAVRRRAGT